jgi:predicted nuclease with TOPRIM domain
MTSSLKVGAFGNLGGKYLLCSFFTEAARAKILAGEVAINISEQINSIKQGSETLTELQLKLREEDDKIKLLETEKKRVAEKINTYLEQQTLIANKKYPELKEKNKTKIPKEIFAEIKKNTAAMVLHKVGSVIVFATDSDYSSSDYQNIKSYISQELKLCRNNKDEIIVTEGSIY